MTAITSRTSVLSSTISTVFGATGRGIGACIRSSRPVGRGSARQVYGNGGALAGRAIDQDVAIRLLDESVDVAEA